MWAGWLSANFNIRRRDIVEDNIRIQEIIGMWDSLKHGS